jgi:hypothetical protein
MSVQTKSNLPQTEPLKWNLRKAAVEFGTTVDTLKKSLNQISAVPDESGLYSTAQLCEAKFGSMFQAKLATQLGLARRVEMENAITKGDFLNRAWLMQAFAAIADAIKSRIMASELSRTVKEDILRDIATLPLAFKDVAHRQTRLLRDGNGDTSDETGDENRPRARSLTVRKSARKSGKAARKTVRQ